MKGHAGKNTWALFFTAFGRNCAWRVYRYAGRGSAGTELAVIWPDIWV